MDLAQAHHWGSLREIVCVCVGGDAGTGARALVFVQAKRPRGWGGGDMDGPCKACEDEGCQKKTLTAGCD